LAISPGTYTVQFKTPVGDGAGEVEFSPDGRLRGGDATFAYDGSWSQEGERFKAALSARRVVSGPPGVFGMDQVDIVVTEGLMAVHPSGARALRGKRRGSSWRSCSRV